MARFNMECVELLKATGATGVDWDCNCFWLVNDEEESLATFDLSAIMGQGVRITKAWILNAAMLIVEFEYE